MEKHMSYALNWAVLTSVMAQSVFIAILIWALTYWLYKKVTRKPLSKVVKGLSYIVVWVASSVGTLMHHMQGQQDTLVYSSVLGFIAAFIVFFFIYFNRSSEDMAE